MEVGLHFIPVDLIFQSVQSDEVSITAVSCLSPMAANRLLPNATEEILTLESPVCLVVQKSLSDDVNKLPESPTATKILLSYIIEEIQEIC